MRDDDRLFGTEYDSAEGGSWSSLYEITAEIDGTVRKVVLEGCTASEAEEVFRSLPGIKRNCSVRIVETKRIMHGIYWIPERGI